MEFNDEINFFLSEAENHIPKIKEEILKLEKNPEDIKPLKDLEFSFKALGALTPMVALDNISKLCYHIGSLLERTKYNEYFKEQIDELKELLFESYDVLNTALNNIKEGNLKDMNEQLLNELKENFEDFKSEYKITFVKPIPREEYDLIASNKSYIFYKVYIRINSTVKFKKVRLFFIFRSLNNLGQICWSNPEPKLLEKGEIEQDFDIFFISKEKSEKIIDVLEEILDIDKKEITKLNPNDLKDILSKSCSDWQVEMEKVKELKPVIDEEFKIKPIPLEQVKSIISDRKNIFYKIYIRIVLGYKFKKTKLYFILNALDELGHIFWSDPVPEILKEGKFDLEFELYMVSKKRKRIISQNLIQIAEICNKRIQEMDHIQFENIVANSKIIQEKQGIILEIKSTKYLKGENSEAGSVIIPLFIANAINWSHGDEINIIFDNKNNQKGIFLFKKEDED